MYTRILINCKRSKKKKKNCVFFTILKKTLSCSFSNRYFFQFLNHYVSLFTIVIRSLKKIIIVKIKKKNDLSNNFFNYFLTSILLENFLFAEKQCHR